MTIVLSITLQVKTKATFDNKKVKAEYVNRMVKHFVELCLALVKLNMQLPRHIFLNKDFPAVFLFRDTLDILGNNFIHTIALLGKTVSNFSHFGLQICEH